MAIRELDGMQRMMHQEAPYPVLLEEIVREWKYRPGWQFRLADIDRGQGSKGLTLDIITLGFNSYHRPSIRVNAFGPEEDSICVDCGEKFPCSAYRIYDAEDAPKGPYRVHHYMIVPAASYDYLSWRRWVLDQCLLVERHEACEFASVGNEHPFAPNHGEGRDPYTIFEYADEEQARTSFKGEVKPKK